MPVGMFSLARLLIRHWVHRPGRAVAPGKSELVFFTIVSDWSKAYFRLISAKWYFAGGFALDGPHYAGNLGLVSTWVQPGRSGSGFNGEERSESQSGRVDKGLCV